MCKLRKVEKKMFWIFWIRCRMMDLKVGDTFRMFEPTGEPVVVKEKTVFEVVSPPFINESGDAAVDHI